MLLLWCWRSSRWSQHAASTSPGIQVLEAHHVSPVWRLGWRRCSSLRARALPLMLATDCITAGDARRRWQRSTLEVWNSSARKNTPELPWRAHTRSHRLHPRHEVRTCDSSCPPRRQQACSQSSVLDAGRPSALAKTKQSGAAGRRPHFQCVAQPLR